jgi:cytochrome c biogenesis protein
MLLSRLRGTDSNKLERVLLRGLAVAGSLRLAIILLILLAVAAVIGGILPQSPVTPSADELYRSYGVFWYRLITRLSLDDVFHSAWFFVLTGVFALNLTLCSVWRIRRSIANLLRRPRYLGMGEAGANTRHIAVNDMSAQTAERILRRGGFRRIARTGEMQLVAWRHGWSILSPDVVHVGILVILVGALLGVFQQEGTFVVNEQEIGVLLPACAGSRDAASKDCVPIPYDVRVDGFGVETYSDGSRVKDYWAELSFLQSQAVVRRGRISVNQPLSIGGFGFYVWRYGDDVQAARVRLQVLDRSVNAVTSEMELRIGETKVVPNTQTWLTALRFYRTFSLDQEGNPMDIGEVAGGHPAVLVQVVGKDKTGADIAYRDLALPFVVDSATTVPRTFILVDAAIPAFLEIHYARNPGYPVVWSGFLVVMVGLAGAFYFRPVRIRVEIEPTAVLLRIEGREAARELESIVQAIHLQYEREGD